MKNKDRIDYLESLIPEGLDVNEKYGKNFDKYARYMGNGIYSYHGLFATDTRELFLMTSLFREGIKFKEV